MKKSVRPLTLELLESRVCPSTITVQNVVDGRTPDVLGYNLGHFMPGTNAADWWRYSGVKAARAFISPSDIEPTDDIPGTGDGVTDSASFLARRAALRGNAANSNVALDNSYINWPVFLNNYANVIGSVNRFTIDYAFSQLRAQGVDILANITASPNRFPLTDDTDWPDKWELWQHYYAEAFYLGSHYDVRRYSMFNEPNNFSGMTPDDWLHRLVVCSDAIQSALADVNARYGKALVPEILAPNTASGSSKYTDWGEPAVLGRQTRLDGTVDPNWSNLQVYNYQKYTTLQHDSGSFSGYIEDIETLKADIAADMPGQTPLPVALTEYNVRTAANYDATTATQDSPADYAALGADSIALAEHDAAQLYLYKFAQTDNTGGNYPVLKNGTHYVHNGTSGANNYGGATKAAEVYRLFNKAAAGGRNHYAFSSNTGSNVWNLFTYDPATKTYYAFITNNTTSSISLDLDLSALGIPEGNQAVVEEVSGNYSGAVSRVASVVGGKLPAATLPAQAVWLVSIPTQSQTITIIADTADTVLGDGSQKNTPGGSAANLLVRADGTVDGRKVTLLKFPISNLTPANLQRVLLDINTSTISQNTIVQSDVYGLNDDSWTEAGATWSNLTSALLQNVPAGNQIGNNVVANPGTTVQMLGQLVVSSTTAADRQIDVTDFVRGQTDGWASFLIVQDHRWDTAIPSLTSGDTQADGIRIVSREAGSPAGPLLRVLATAFTNNTPVANSDLFNVLEDQTLTVPSPGVLGNDTDVDPGTGQAETLTAIVVSDAGHGTLTLHSDGSFTYTGAANYNGTDSFTYKVDDGGTGAHLSNTATVLIVVNAVNDAPVQNNDSYSVFEDQTLAVAAAGVLANDTDVDPGTGQPEITTAILINTTSHGSLTLHADGSFVYLSDPNFNGTDVFTYVSNDGSLSSASATVTITVIPVNDAPVAGNDLFSVFEDQSFGVGAAGVLDNDFDTDSPMLTALLVNPTQHGTLTLNADGSLAYFANADYNGTDSFTYKANDGSLNSGLATVSIVVVSVNDPPVAGDDAYSVFENQTLSVAAAGVLRNDNDIDSPSLTAVLSSGPARGVLTFNADGSFVYTPVANYSGTDTFTYRANDGLLGSNLATVSITVVPVNQAPVAGDDALSVFENQTLVVGAAGVLTNDSDVDSPTLTALLATGPVHGTLTLNSNGSLIYTPNAFFSGADSFTYKANDGLLNSNLATVSINVDPVNQGPTANNDAYSLFEDFTLTRAVPGVLANDTDVDSPVLATNLVAGPAHGTLSFNTNGAFSYVPGLHYFGTDSFTYKANDGLLNSDVATVKITVIAVNHAPLANSNSYSVFEDSSLSVSTPGVLNNDSDIDGNSLTSILLASPTHGTLTLRSNGAFTYTPATHFSGGDSFTYRTNDGSLNSTAATVTLNVLFVNHAPTANADAYTVQGDTTLIAAVASGVLANDTDVENSALTALLAAGPAHGTLTLNVNGSFTYTPSSGFVGTDSFRYRANDGSLNSSQATVTLTVQAPGPVAPSATDVSDLVRAVSSALTDDHDGTFSGTITITNITSSTDMDGPLQIVLTNLTSGVTMQNKTGDTPAGDPYITIPAALLPGGKLGHGQSVQVTVVFDDPLALSISYVTKTLSGTI